MSEGLDAVLDGGDNVDERLFEGECAHVLGDWMGESFERGEVGWYRVVIMGDDGGGDNGERDCCGDGDEVVDEFGFNGVSGWLGGVRVVGVVDGFGAGWLEDELTGSVWKMLDESIVCVDGHIRSLLWCWL